jgi:hypothetical protein
MSNNYLQVLVERVLSLKAWKSIIIGPGSVIKQDGSGKKRY